MSACCDAELRSAMQNKKILYAVCSCQLISIFRGLILITQSSNCTNYLCSVHVFVIVWTSASSVAKSCMHVIMLNVCKSAISFSLTSCGRSVWCGTENTPTPYVLVCCLYGCMCPSVNVCVCVQVETQASKHSLFTHSCWATDLCECVCMDECFAECILPEARGQTAAAENKKLCQRVSRQTRLTHTSASTATFRNFSADQFSNHFTVCRWLFKRFLAKTLSDSDCVG